MAGFNVPPIDRLKSTLATSGLQDQNQALYQTIWLIIEWMRQFQIQVTGTSSAGGGGGGGGLLNQSFITANNDTATLPNSLQLIAGANITITIGPGQITIASTAESIVNNNVFQNLEILTADLELQFNRRNGRTSIYGRFSADQIGAPIIMVQQPHRDASDGLVTFSAEIISTRTMHVYWQAPNGAPRKVRVNYLIGESNVSD